MFTSSTNNREVKLIRHIQGEIHPEDGTFIYHPSPSRE